MAVYTIKEMYRTLQGEGVHTGRPAVFVRFSGFNLWSGLEAERNNAICRFCDTEFRGTDGPLGGKYSAQELVRTVLDLWAETAQRPFVVLTGGEPMLQVDRACINALHAAGCEIAIETNGTLPVPREIDWICVSPKAGTELVQRSGHELKLVFPQDEIDPQIYLTMDFKYFSLQPMDGVRLDKNTRDAVAYCHRHPEWRLSVQTHKILGIP
jgi:7-carboxy-7-deazaguanine synthase (Cx14CxxC type)